MTRPKVSLSTPVNSSNGTPEPDRQLGNGQADGTDFMFGADAEAPVTDPAVNLDPFNNLDQLRLGTDFNAAIGVKKALLSVPVRKPEKSWFCRVHSSEAYRLQTAVIETSGDRNRESYLVSRNLWPELMAEPTFRPKLLATAINRQGVLFLWELNLPRGDGRKDEWTRTALEAVTLATTKWVRVAANMSAGSYDVYEAGGSLTEPEWPEHSFQDLLRIAFRDRIISSLDHPVLRQLRGEV